MSDPSKCKREACMKDGDRVERYEGYCSLHCRDMDDEYFRGALAALEMVRGAEPDNCGDYYCGACGCIDDWSKAIDAIRDLLEGER